MFYSAHTKGFTLIELLITMSLAAFLMVSGSIAIGNSRKNQTIKKAQQELKIDLEKAKNDAFYGKKPEGCVGVYARNEFYFDQASKTYTISAMCSTPVVIMTKTFGSEISVTVPSPNRIYFKTVTGAVEKYNASTSKYEPLVSELTYTLQLESSLIKTVTINQSGGINASD